MTVVVTASPPKRATRCAYATGGLGGVMRTDPAPAATARTRTVAGSIGRAVWP